MRVKCSSCTSQSDWNGVLSAMGVGDGLSFNKCVMHYIIVDFPFPLKEVMGEESTAYFALKTN